MFDDPDVHDPHTLVIGSEEGDTRQSAIVRRNPAVRAFIGLGFCSIDGRADSMLKTYLIVYFASKGGRCGEASEVYA